MKHDPITRGYIKDGAKFVIGFIAFTVIAVLVAAGIAAVVS